MKYLKTYKIFESSSKDNLNRKGINGWTPLITASWNNYIFKIKYLIEKGCDLNIRELGGHTAYYFDEKYFNSYEFQKWFLTESGRSYIELQKFVNYNIHPDIKRKVINGVFQKELDQLGMI